MSGWNAQWVNSRSKSKNFLEFLVIFRRFWNFFDFLGIIRLGIFKEFLGTFLEFTRTFLDFSISIQPMCTWGNAADDASFQT
jgi:hypothetical protein